MITVNRVYVDAEWVVRMSPTGWPEEKELNGITGHITMAENQAALQKAKEESIPFEDQKRIKSIIFESNILGRGKFYTIEPIQVKLVEACNCESCPVYASCEHCQKPVTIARIVTEEEKPAPDIVHESVCAKCGGVGFYHLGTHARITCSCMRSAPFSGNIKAILKCDDEGIRLAVEEYARQNGLKLVPEDRVSELKDLTANGNNLIQSNPEEQPRQPAPVVDKPDFERIAASKAFEIWVNKYPTLNPENWPDEISGYTKAFVEGAKYANHQQPTEWIPVSERLPEETEPVMWCRVPVEEPYEIASMLDVGFDYKYYTHWRPLPESPK